MRSFFYGIVITSILWLLALFLIFPGDFWTRTSHEEIIHDGTNHNRRLTRRHQKGQHHQSNAEFSPIGFDSKQEILTNMNSLQSELIQIDWFHQFNANPPNTSDNNHSLGHSISKDQHDISTQRLSIIRTILDQKLKLAGFRKFAFNLLISNRLGLFRPLPDTRNELCKDIEYIDDRLLPTASIIICYYNEAPSALMRTVYTILERSHGLPLLEIILVDDYSDDEFRQYNMSDYVKSPLLKMLRTPERAGLVRARLFGSRQAKGEVLVFLDSHVEPNEDWLRPLLQEVSKNNSTLACPIIDVINPNTLQYSSSPMVKGGVNWGLHFKWDSVTRDFLKTKKDFVKPIPSPTMAGGLFAVNRQYFKHLGEYDEGMNIWGGENIELSFRTWMCGGQIKILPCSKVGHIFRHRRPYGSNEGEDTLVHNSLRAALVWLDEYKENFYDAHPESRNMDAGDVIDRINLRKSLNCTNFTWYIDNVYPSLRQEKLTEKRLDSKWQMLKDKYGNKTSQRKNMQALASMQYGLNKNWSKQSALSHALEFDERLPIRLPKVVMRYQIQLFNSNLCIESKDGVLHKGSRLILNYCAKTDNIPGNHLKQFENVDNNRISNQLWSETQKKDLRLSDMLCLDAVKNLPVLRKCHNAGSFQEWTHSNGVRGVSIYNSAGGLCLGVERAQAGEPLLVTICENNYDNIIDDNSWLSMTFQKWNLLIENPNHSNRKPIPPKQKYSHEMYNTI